MHNEAIIKGGKMGGGFSAPDASENKVSQMFLFFRQDVKYHIKLTQKWKILNSNFATPCISGLTISPFYQLS
jgi:hypothetical protein